MTKTYNSTPTVDQLIEYLEADDNIHSEFHDLDVSWFNEECLEIKGGLIGRDQFKRTFIRDGENVFQELLKHILETKPRIVRAFIEFIVFEYPEESPLKYLTEIYPMEDLEDTKFINILWGYADVNANKYCRQNNIRNLNINKENNFSGLRLAHYMVEFLKIARQRGLTSKQGGI